MKSGASIRRITPLALFRKNQRAPVALSFGPHRSRLRAPAFPDTSSKIIAECGLHRQPQKDR